MPSHFGGGAVVAGFLRSATVLHRPALDHPLVIAAAAYAAGVHLRDVRKGSGASYFEAHLAPVAEMVAAQGGDAVQVAVAYLHDTAEDHGGHARIEHLATYFGSDVAQMVADLSDSLVEVDAGKDKAPWHERKVAFIERLATMPRRTLEVAAADKLHNATTIRDDYRTVGDELWMRFTTASATDQCWYYHSIAQIISERLPDHPTAAALTSVVAELLAEVGVNASELRSPAASGRR